MHEQCGIVAAADLSQTCDVVPVAVQLAAGVQHRGDLGAGIAWLADAAQHQINVIKGNGLVPEVLTPKALNGARGTAAIAHTRYATSGSRDACLAQPFRAGKNDAPFAFGFNGNLANFRELQEDLAREGHRTEHDVDTDVIRIILEREITERRKSMRDAIASLQEEIDGACNIVTLSADGSIHAYRDRKGFHPLAFAEGQDGIAMVASEDSAILQRESGVVPHSLKPGECVSIEPQLRRITREQLHSPETARCFFEWVYFAHVLSTMDNRGVMQARFRFGEKLGAMDNEMAHDHVVVAVPDSARIVAEGYAKVRGLQRRDAIQKVEDRLTFIAGEGRHEKVRRKYTIDPALIRDQSIVLLDDSVVRGTTMKGLVKRLHEEAGPMEIHLRLACPPILAPCYYGIDFPTTNELLVRQHSRNGLGVGELPPEVLASIAETLHVDSVRFLPVEAIPAILGFPRSELCMSCVDGHYPTEAGRRRYEHSTEEISGIASVPHLG